MTESLTPAEQRDNRIALWRQELTELANGEGDGPDLRPPEALLDALCADVWDQCLERVTSGIESAKNAHAERTGDKHSRAIVSSLVGLMGAVPRTENPYRS